MSLDYKPEEGLSKRDTKVPVIRAKHNRERIVDMDALCERLLPFYEHLQQSEDDAWMEEYDAGALLGDPYGALSRLMSLHILLEPDILLVFLELVIDAFRVLSAENLRDMVTVDFLVEISEYLTGEDKDFHELILIIYVKCLKYNESAEIFEEVWALFERHILECEAELSTEILDRALQLFAVVPLQRFSHKIECQFLDFVSCINMESDKFPLQRRLCKTVYRLTQKLCDINEYWLGRFRSCAACIFGACGAAEVTEGKIWMLKSERYLNKFSAAPDWTMTDGIISLGCNGDESLMELIHLNLWEIDKTQVPITQVEEYSFEFKSAPHGPYSCYMTAGKVNEIMSE